MNNYDEIKKLYDNDVNPNLETSIKKQFKKKYVKIHFRKEVYFYGFKRTKIQKVFF